MIPSTEIKQWVDLAASAAKSGGELLTGYFRNVDPATIEAKRINDWVSEADRAAEAEVIKIIRSMAPDHSFYTEEAGYLPGNASSPYCWIIDPLDGTTNFLRGFPIWAVSVALEYRPDRSQKWGEIVAGAIAIPTTGELFTAGLGLGSRRNGAIFTTGPGREFAKSLLGTGFPFRIRSHHSEYIDLFGEILKRCADVRRPGAVAVDLCYTAMGVFDGFWELDLSPWDVAAGGLIIREAGGLTSNFQGEPDYITSGDIVTGNRVILEELTSLCKSYFPTPRNVDKSPPR